MPQKKRLTTTEEHKLTFESFVKKERPEWADFSKEPDGRYTDRRLNTMFAGFAMGLRASREIGRGKFVIGKVINNTNIPIFGERPRLHSRLVTVNSELERLCDQSNEQGEEATYVVYRSIFARPSFKRKK